MLPNRPNAGAQTLALATGVLLVVGVTVAAFPEVVPVGLRIAPVAQATSPSAAADVLPRAALVDEPPDDPPPSEISTLHAFATAAGATASGPQFAPEPTEPPEPEEPEQERAPMSVSGTEGEVIALTNKERNEHGCGSLAPDARLARAARAHAEDMAENGYFSHVSRDGRRFEHRVRAAGYPRPGAENIGKGQTSAAQVVREWMASPSHRSALLTCGFTTIGVARAGNYWVQEFGK
ncbi:CAP domain-containing protein [Pseudonocardia sichuanensis]